MSPLPPDPYVILGVSKDAQVPEIRSAHRKLVLRCHPDKVPDPRLKAEKQDEFQKVQQAYELLSDENERQKYDDLVKLAELRRQFQNKANISTPRSSPKEYSVYTAEPPRPRDHSPPRPPVPKMYAYSRSWEEGGPRMFDAGPPRSSRREASYAERPSKREMEREREKEHEVRDREKERDRRRKTEDGRHATKDAKELRRTEKKQRDKQRDKDIRRETDEKKRHYKPYIESFDDEPPSSKADKKKSSSKKHEERRERSSGREDGSPTTAMPPRPPGPQRAYSAAMEFAASYIEASRAKNGAVPTLQRSKAYHTRNVQPPVPTPPPVAGQSSPFAAPDEPARQRRGSGEGARLSRERSHRASSREAADDPMMGNTSPARPSAQFQKSTTMPPVMSSPPPRRDLPRTSSLPVDASYSRPMPSMTRAHTFTTFGDGAPRGRGPSRMHSQIEEESDSDDGYGRRARDGDHKHRPGRRHRTPEGPRPENVSHYQVDGGRAKLQSSYSRRLEPDKDPFRYYSTSGGIPVVESRPPMVARDGSYTASGMKFAKVKTSKAYGYDDVQYSNYYDRPYRGGYTAYA